MERSAGKVRFLKRKAPFRGAVPSRYQSSAQVRERLLLFWARACSLEWTKVPASVLREICEFLYAQQVLVCVRQREVRFFDTRRELWQRLWPKEENLGEYGHGYSVLFLQGGQIMLCGGYRLSSTGRTVENNHAHILDHGKVVRLPDIRHSRYQHSAAFLPSTQAVYVFGGVGLTFPYASYFAKCEKLLLTADSWTGIADLSKPRVGINACIYLDRIYLCGGDALGTIEAFDWKTESFSQLPGVYLPISGSCVTIITPTQCFSVAKDVSCWWQLKSKDAVRSVRHQPCKPYSLCAPWVSGDSVYLVNPYGCVRYSLTSGELVGNYDID